MPIHCRRSSNSFCSCSRKAPAKAIYAPLFSANGWALWILAHPLRLSFSVSPLIRRRYLWLQAGERRDDLDLPAYVTRGRRVPVHWLCTAATNSGGGGAPVLTSSAMRVHERSSWVVWSARSSFGISVQISLLSGIQAEILLNANFKWHCLVRTSPTEELSLVFLPAPISPMAARTVASSYLINLTFNCQR